MEVLLAENAGFCYGVKRAINTLQELLQNGEKPCTLGKIIHNEAVIKELEFKGVKVLNSVNQTQKYETLVIRAHGVAQKVIKEIEKLGICHVDATCPFVKKIHKIVSTLPKSSILLIAGDLNHPEVEGIIGNTNVQAFVFKTCQNIKEILKLKNFKKEEVTVVSQTTFGREKFKECVNYLKNEIPNLTVYDTICNTSATRQQEVEELAKTCDIVVIIGSKNSANTKELYQLAKRWGRAMLIESESELKKEKFDGIKRVGVSAGASTPQAVVAKVIDWLKNIKSKN